MALTTEDIGGVENPLKSEMLRPEVFSERITSFAAKYEESEDHTAFLGALLESDIIAEDRKDELSSRINELWSGQLKKDLPNNQGVYNLIQGLDCIKQVKEINPVLMDFLNFVLKAYYIEYAKDPGHDITHIYGMLHEYEKIKLAYPDKLTEVNVPNLVSMIVLHDVYTARIPKNNPVRSAYAWFKDGKGSAELIENRVIAEYMWTKGVENANFHNMTDYQLEKYIGISADQYEEIMEAVISHSTQKDKKKYGPIRNLTSQLFYYLDTYSLGNTDRQTQLMGENTKKIMKLRMFFTMAKPRKLSNSLAYKMLDKLYISAEPILSESLEFLREEYNKRLIFSLEIANLYLESLGLDQIDFSQNFIDGESIQNEIRNAEILMASGQ